VQTKKVSTNEAKSKRRRAGGPATHLAFEKEEEEEEEEEGLYLQIETRKRVQTNEAKSKRRRALPTKIHRSTGQHPGLPVPAFPPSAAG